MVSTRKATGKLPPPKYADLTPETAMAEQSERPKKRARTRKASRKTGEEPDGRNDEAAAASSSGANTTTGPRRRRTGRLAMMMSLPFDVFCEIGHHLGPNDLLRLSRSSKVFRKLLMSKSSRPIWRAAEETVGLPECPLDLSCPQYASFVFDTFCTHCIDAKAYRHEVELRVRLCQQCLRKWITTGKNLPFDYVIYTLSLDIRNDARKNPELFVLLPGQGQHSAALLDEKNLQNLKKCDFKDIRYYSPHFQASFEKYMSFDPFSGERKTFVDERRTNALEILQQAPALIRWLRDRRESKAEDNRDARRRREESIYDKLEELGYTYVDMRDNLDEKDWKWDSLINQPRLLTDRIWIKIRPQLEETIRLRREKKARLDKESTIGRRQSNLLKLSRDLIHSQDGKGSCFVPKDVVCLPLAQELIGRDELGPEISRTHWESLKQQILDLSESRKLKLIDEAISKIANARRQAGLQVLDFAVESSKGSPAGMEESSKLILHHATSLFKYQPTGIEHIVFFTKILEEAHDACLQKFVSLGDFENRRAFTCAVETSERVVSIAEALYIAIGLSARTMDEIMALGKSFVCLRCGPISRELMSWTDLVQHFHDEFINYERREKAKSRMTDGSNIVNLYDHDERVPGLLATCIGVEAQSSASETPAVLKKLIEVCDCESHKSYCYGEYCKVCNGRLACKGKLKAHMRAKHGQELD